MFIKREKLSFTYTADNYMLQYKGQNIGGAGVKLPRDKRLTSKQRAENLRDFLASAERDIQALIEGRGQYRYLQAIQKIDQQLAAANNKRICDLCGSDRTAHDEGLALVTDWRGNHIGLVGSCCGAEATRMRNKLAGLHGGYVDEVGTILASPRGTPVIHSFAQLREAIGETVPAPQAQDKQQD